MNNLFLHTMQMMVRSDIEIDIYKDLIKKRTSPHMYLWRKQWNWMSSTMLFKQNRIV
ncbi:hypothetical protein [Spiroplasma ixodetis]|uniref:hypothetical protein n=1 Tax=Spiroplasma ixodetis TaxID=2141 RepID=UPI002578496D|nr:hypothetical protein [Spiroplasma ixodetis]